MIIQNSFSLTLIHFIKKHLTAFMVIASTTLLLALQSFFGLDYKIRLWIQDAFTESQVKEQSLWLPAYSVIKKNHINCVDREVSGLSYSETRKTWFAVLDKPTTLIEFNDDGHCINKLALSPLTDTEAIVWVGQGQFVIAEERKLSLSLISLTDISGSNITIKTLITLPALGKNNNKGFEGLAYIEASSSLLVAKERKPKKIFEINGLLSNGREPVTLKRRKDLLPTGLDMNDISGLHVDSHSGNLLIVSDQASKLAEVTLQGEILNSIRFKRYYHGFDEKLLKAEGIASNNSGDIAIVAEPNIFIIMRKDNQRYPH